MRLAYLGPAGTFTEEAAVLYDPHASLAPYPTITTAASSVLAGESDEAVAPIENSLEGAVTETVDLLIHERGFRVKRELNVRVVHHLMAVPSVALKEIKRVYSHPQALGQCRVWLSKHLPHVDLAAALSTAASVEQAGADSVPAGAIAPYRAARLYGARILASGIQDNDANMTRFVVLATDDSPPTGDDKTSLCLSFDEDRPGLLYEVMGEFANNGINLTKVESRPTRLGLGRYYFLIDLQGHRSDPRVAEVLERVERATSELTVFGSYPRFQS